MAESTTGELYREVVVPSSSCIRWKEITVNTGASASTLQDIKVPESSGGFAYCDSGLAQSPVRNRFIYWRTSNDVLELVEQALDCNLSGGHVKIRFQDTPILDGVSIHEAHGCVVVLVPTVASVHRLVFPHPNKIQRGDLTYTSVDQPLLSVFYDASLANTSDQKNVHMLNPGGSITSHLHTAATYLTSEGEALFVLATSVGSILMIRMPALGIQGIVQQYEMSQSSVMQKLWTGLVPAMMRGGQEAADTVSSLVIHPLKADIYIFAVCRDNKLRIWSTKNRECVLVCNLLDYTPESMQPQTAVPGGSGHVIRKMINNDLSLKLCVYLSFPDRTQFCLLQPQFVSGRFQMFHISTVFSPPEELTDYCATPDHMWTLWTNQSGETVARVVSIDSEPRKNSNWVEIILHPPESADILVPRHLDPREVYMERIFHPGGFSLQDIHKALNVYRRSLDTNLALDIALNINSLKEEVTVAVETEIRNAAIDYEMQEEDYYQLQMDKWSKFYSCCIQYQEVGAKLKGVFADPVTGLVCFIRKGTVTYIRPCDSAEVLYLGTGPVPDLPMFTGDQAAHIDWSMRRDLSKLCECVRLVSREISDDIAMQFEYEVSMLESPESLAKQIVDVLFFSAELEDGASRTDSLGGLLTTIHDLPVALDSILRALDLSQPAEEDSDMDDSDINANHQLSCSKLFTSSVAMEILSVSLEQFAHTRLSALRDILILQMAALRLGDRDGVTPAAADMINDTLVPQTVSLLRSYLVLKWTTQKVSESSQNSSLEFNMRQLATLDISNSPGIFMHRTATSNTTLASLFIQGVGGAQARGMLAQSSLMEDDPSATWSGALLLLVKNLAKLIWPVSDGFLFPEFLVGCCQYLAVQEYVRLLSSWCQWNAASRRFVLGLSYLHFDEPHKAAQCFTEAKEGVGHESFLRQKLIQTGETQIRKLEVLYYLKVIKQFEEFGVADVVISLAETAVSVADDDDTNVPTLWSKVFKYQLELGHNTEAYSAMVANPDQHRRKDCLRQLLVMLCERGDLQALVEFPYIDLEDEVVSILESRARSVDLSTHNYYDVLYAFHIFRNNFKKAGSVMYEHGMRLGRELPGLRGLQRQAQCYLSALNALRMVKPEYAWIVKPVPAARKTVLEEAPGLSPKHALDGEDKADTPAFRKLELLELSDIEKEFLLVDARLRLIRRDPDAGLTSGPSPAPDEMVGLLVNVGLFDRAVIICNTFSLQLNTVFENLALRCVNLAKHSTYYMRGDNDYTSQAWEWLKENHLTLTQIAKESSAADQCWQLLQQYLDRYDDATGRYHRCTAIKLMSHGFDLPTWFVNSYKGLNVAELLRLYIDFDLLEEGVALAVEYIDAVLESCTRGQDSQLFKLKGCLRYAPQTVWLPYTCIDQLLLSLRDHQHNIVYGKLYEALQEKLMIYQEKIEILSQQIHHS